MAVIKLIISFILSIGQILLPVSNVVESGEAAFFTEWSEEMAFTQDAYAVLEKNPDEDFVILNLTDIQLDDVELYDGTGDRTNAMINKLITETEPDLITLTGDNAIGTMSYLDLVSYIDSFGIPWAPVMGNHDGQGCINECWAAQLFDDAENCLFKFGPEDMGYGNYILNITENGRIIHTLFMMDTHGSKLYKDNLGKVFDGYDHLWPNQIKWYKWAVNGISETAGRTVESTVFMHIPVVEYKDAWDAAWNPETESFRLEYAFTSFGVNLEAPCSAPVNNGFFSVCKELGSTKNMVCGHDHINSSSILYDGIRLTYGLKLGEGSYSNNDLMGGTTLTINSFGNVTTEHHYIDITTLA